MYSGARFTDKDVSRNAEQHSQRFTLSSLLSVTDDWQISGAKLLSSLRRDVATNKNVFTNIVSLL